MSIVSGKFIASDAAVNVECGFIPDYVKAISVLGATELEWEWYKVLYDTVTEAQGKFGFNQTGGATPTPNTDGSGIVPYNSSVESVLLPAPDGDGFKKAPSIADYNKDTSYSTARTTSQLGVVVRPTTHNGFVYEATTAGGTGGTEPTWPTVPGESISDDNNTWICREERIVRTGVLGFTVQVSVATNGELWVFKAEKHDRHADMGDADVENPVTFAD